MANYILLFIINVGVAGMLSTLISVLGGLHYILQFACRWILFDKINKSIVHERRLFQNWYVFRSRLVSATLGVKKCILKFPIRRFAEFESVGWENNVP